MIQFSDSDFQEASAFAMWCSHEEAPRSVEPDEYLYGFAEHTCGEEQATQDEEF